MPVLTGPGEVALPLPSEPGYSWSWIERSGDGWIEVPHHPTGHKADLVAVHKEAENFRLEAQKAAASPIPFHPGAVKYFNEKGIKLQ